MKWLLFIFLCLLLGACQETSKVDPMAPAIPLKESHGDGTYAIFTIVLPLSDDSIPTVDSPIDPNTGLSRVPIVGDLVRLASQTFLNLAAELGLGQKRITINQPIPDLNSPYLKSISIKRVFFHIENVTEDTRSASNIISQLFDGFRGIIRGETRLDFSFMRAVGINLRMEKTAEDPASYKTEVVKDELSEDASEPQPNIEIGSEEGPRKIELLKYKRSDRRNLLRNAERGAMFIVYTSKPVQVRAFLRKDKNLSALIKEMVIVNKTLVVELTGKQQVAENFFELMRSYEAEMEQNGITKIDACDEDICMDLKVNQQNMMPFLLQGNKLRIETNIDSSRMPPKSFQVKGYIEFEVKLDPGF